jgi:hypothetical protein
MPALPCGRDCLRFTARLAMMGADLRRASLWAAAVRGTANVLTLIAYLLAALVFVLPWVVLMAWSLVYLTHLLLGRD